MAEATLDAFVAQMHADLAAASSQPYEVFASGLRRGVARQVMVLLQEFTGARAAALSPDKVSYGPGSADKRLARDLGRRLESGRPFTPRQVQVAAYLASRYRRQIDTSLVPICPVNKP